MSKINEVTIDDLIAKEERMITMYEAELSFWQDSQQNLNTSEGKDEHDPDDDPLEWILGSKSAAEQLSSEIFGDSNEGYSEQDEEDILASQSVLRGFCFTHVERLKRRRDSLSSSSQQGFLHDESVKLVSYRLKGHFLLPQPAFASPTAAAEIRLDFEIPTKDPARKQGITDHSAASQTAKSTELSTIPRVVYMNAKLVDPDWTWLNQELATTATQARTSRRKGERNQERELETVTALFENDLPSWMNTITNYINFEHRRQEVLSVLKEQGRLTYETLVTEVVPTTTVTLQTPLQQSNETSHSLTGRSFTCLWCWSWIDGGGDYLQVLENPSLSSFSLSSSASSPGQTLFQQSDLDFMVDTCGSCEMVIQQIFPPLRTSLTVQGEKVERRDCAAKLLEKDDIDVCDKEMFDNRPDAHGSPETSSSRGEDESEQDDSRQLSDYELLRLERIKRNEDYLEKLGLLRKEEPVTKKKRHHPKKEKRALSVERRSSLRLRGGESVNQWKAREGFSGLVSATLGRQTISSHALNEHNSHQSVSSAQYFPNSLSRNLPSSSLETVSAACGLATRSGIAGPLEKKGVRQSTASKQNVSPLKIKQNDFYFSNKLVSATKSLHKKFKPIPSKPFPTINSYGKVHESASEDSEEEWRGLKHISFPPKTPPRIQTDGTFARPRGMAPTGCIWDRTRGVWVKK